MFGSSRSSPHTKAALPEENWPASASPSSRRPWGQGLSRSVSFEVQLYCRLLQPASLARNPTSNAADWTGMALDGAQAVTVPQIPELEATVESSGQGTHPCPIRSERPHVAHVSGKPR